MELEKFNQINCRTQTIEYAVGALSENVSEPTMTDTREYLDNFVSNKIKTGRTLKTKLPNDEEVEYDEKKRICDLYSYKSDEKEIFTRAKEGWLNNDEHFIANAQGKATKISDWLKALKDVSWTVRADCIPAYIETILNIADYTQNGNRHQENLYLHSAVEGNGKSTLANTLRKAFEATGAKTATGNWPVGQYTDTTVFSRNAVVGIDDTDWDVVRNINENQLKAILRREDSATLSCNIKFHPTFNVKPRAVLIACGNTNPPRCDDRTWKIIETNAITVETAQDCESLIQPLYKSLDAYLYILQVDKQSYKDSKAILKRYREKEYTNIDKSFPDFTRNPYISSAVIELLEYLNKYKSAMIDFKNMSLANLLFEMNDTEQKKRLATRLTKALKYLSSTKQIKAVTYGADLYAKWNVTNILNWNADDIASQQKVEADGEDEVLKTLATWDKIIKIAEDYENDPNNKFLKGDTDATLDDSWTVCSKYDKEGEYDKNGDQVCVNKPLNPDKPNRRNDGVHKQNYLFECDDIPVKDQVEMIENAPEELKDSIYWVCYTGGKSIHTVIKTNTPDTATSEMRKYIHTKLNEKYFQGHADPSGQNASRLARAPNAIRQDEKHPGKKQLCLYFNHSEPIALDVRDIIADFEEEQRLQKTLTEVVSGFENNNRIPKNNEQIQINTLEALKEWNEKHPTKAKEECIKLLEGRLEDWNRAIACVRELRNFGFTDYDILSEGPSNDKWIKSAVKGAK